MRKTWMACILTGMMSLVAYPAHALVDTSDLVLGGVTLGEAYEDVEALYGPPTSRRIGGYWYGVINYGDSVHMTIQPDRDNPDQFYIYGVTSDGANGLATPKGITVGSTVDELLEAYGAPDRSGFDRSDGGEYYMYYDNENQRRGSYLWCNIKNGVVTKITIHVNTGE